MVRQIPTLPTAKDENYRFVPLYKKDFKQGLETANKSKIPSAKLEGHCLAHLRLVDGPAAYEFSVSPKVEAIELSEKSGSDEFLVEAFGKDYFACLAQSNLKSSLDIRIKEQWPADGVLRISQLLESSASHRILLHLEKNTVASVLFDISAQDLKNKGSLLSLIEVHLEAGAHLKFFTLQELAPEQSFCLRQGVKLEKDSHLELFAYHRGSGLGQHRVQGHCFEPGSLSNVEFAVKGRDDDKIDLWIENLHSCPDTQSDTKVWSVLADRSQSVFNGNIVITPEGTRTLAYQSNKNLVLEDTAWAHAIPKLEIATDDVKCSHGASMVTLDEDQLFYLKSRGIPHEQAKKLLIDAFTAEVLRHLPLEDFRSRLLRSDEFFAKEASN